MSWAYEALVERWQMLIALAPRARRLAIKNNQLLEEGWSAQRSDNALRIWQEIGMKYQSCARAGLTRGKLDDYANTALAMELGW